MHHTIFILFLLLAALLVGCGDDGDDGGGEEQQGDPTVDYELWGQNCGVVGVQDCGAGLSCSTGKCLQETEDPSKCRADDFHVEADQNGPARCLLDCTSSDSPDACYDPVNFNPNRNNFCGNPCP